jgi:broad specificity phosphatase PhoE
MRIIIVRHGETEENAAHVLMGHTPGKLTKLGIEQTKIVSLKLKNEKIDVVLSSDLKRVVDTTNEIIKYHNVPVLRFKELRERNFGIFERKPLRDLIEAERASGVAPVYFRPIGGESFGDVERRVKKLMDHVYAEYKNKVVLISTHAGVAQVLMSIYFARPLEEMLVTKPKNTGVLILDVGKNKATLIKDEMF